MWAVEHMNIFLSSKYFTQTLLDNEKGPFFVCWVELTVYEPWIVGNINLCIKGISESDSFVFKLGLQNLAVIHIWH